MTEILSANTAPWIGWMAFGVLLAIGELVVPGIFLIWIAIAAGLTGTIAWGMPAVPIPVQVLIFAGLCLIAAWGGRRWYDRNPIVSDDPMLNDRAARLVGRMVTVVDPILNGEGRVRIDDGTWNAAGPDADAGERLMVVRAEGATLTVAWPAALDAVSPSLTSQP